MPYPTAFAVTHPGLESVLAAELTALGAATGAVEPGGVEFPGTPELIARANLELRTASRILVRVAEFHARSFAELERHATRIEWARWLPPGAAGHVRVTTKKSKLYHERAIVERFAAAIAVRCTKVSVVAARGDADAEELDPDSTLQRFVVRVFRDRCLVSVDASGARLHRRGYRLETARAPLRETLASGLLLAAGWDGSSALVDPFCGSGTIPIEGAMIARRIAPGLRRTFSFERWPEFDGKLVRRIRAELSDRIRPLGVIIRGADRDRGALEAAASNAERAGVAGDVDWRRAVISSLAVPEGPGLIATNPPYGARIGEVARLRDLYAQLGHVTRAVAPGWPVAMISAREPLERQTGLAWRELLRTENGGIRVRFVIAEVPSR